MHPKRDVNMYGIPIRQKYAVPRPRMIWETKISNTHARDTRRNLFGIFNNTRYEILQAARIIVKLRIYQPIANERMEDKKSNKIPCTKMRIITLDGEDVVLNSLWYGSWINCQLHATSAKLRQWRTCHKNVPNVNNYCANKQFSSTMVSAHIDSERERAVRAAAPVTMYTASAKGW